MVVLFTPTCGGRGEGGVGVALLCVEHSYGFGLDQYTHLLTTTITNLCSLFNKGCVTPWPCHSLTSLLRQKKNYGNSNIISPCKNIPNLQSNPLKETKILQDIIITL